MVVLKCKMCGGDVAPVENQSYGHCEWCGSTVTIPKIDDDSRVNIYNRANNFRQTFQFDKAIDAYERILAQDDTDAEAHFGIMLAKYGICFVEENKTGTRIPTCRRPQMTSVLSDPNYLKALEYARDNFSRELYETEGRQIFEIQKGIIELTQNEAPYDVFICYKETDENGQRTRDSLDAQNIYFELTDKGYKVFFAKITLEKKLGVSYESYIFQALNTAKIMLVIGSKPEYFNAVWVKNEWSRFLDIMKDDRKKMLYPCYKDMDPYEIPDELAIYQAQNLAKIGALQDLIHGISKVIDKPKKEEAPRQAVYQDATYGRQFKRLEQAQSFLDVGKYAEASGIYDAFTVTDPELYIAWWGKILCESKTLTLIKPGEIDLTLLESWFVHIEIHCPPEEYLDIVEQFTQYKAQISTESDIANVAKLSREKDAQLNEASAKINALINEKNEKINEHKNRINQEEAGFIEWETRVKELSASVNSSRILSMVCVGAVLWSLFFGYAFFHYALGWWGIFTWLARVAIILVGGFIGFGAISVYFSEKSDLRKTKKNRPDVKEVEAQSNANIEQDTKAYDNAIVAAKEAKNNLAFEAAQFHEYLSFNREVLLKYWIVEECRKEGIASKVGEAPPKVLSQRLILGLK